MNFLSPTSFFLIGLAVPIIALYILKLRRRRETVSTLMFWEELFQERQTTALFHRLKHFLSLLIQLLFLALLVLALAEPQFAFITKSAQQFILIIDQSASMNTLENPHQLTRLETAKQLALRTVEQLRYIDEMTVISSHMQPVIHSPSTNHQKSLRTAIEAIQATDIKTNLEPAFDLAQAIAQTKTNPKIMIFSDFQSISDELLAKLRSRPEHHKENGKQERVSKHRLIRIGDVSENVGITQFRVRKSLANAFDYQTLLHVVNASKTAKKFNVELYFNENLFDVRPYTLATGESKSEIFSNFAFEGGKLKAVLDLQDALPTDNIAYATLPKRDTISVLIVTSENLFLQNALAVDEQLKLTVLTPAEYELRASAEKPNVQAESEYQVIIFDRYSPTILGNGNYMFIYPPAASSHPNQPNPELKWKIGALLETPIITEWTRTHPILRHVRLQNVQIREAYHVTPPLTAEVIARSFESPLLFVDVTPDRKIVFAAVDIMQSDLPLRIAFPIIIANTIQWFLQGSSTQEYHLQTGEILRQPIESLSTTSQQLTSETATDQNSPKLIKITGPGDKTWEISVEQDELFFDQTQHAGFYELKIEDASLSVATDARQAAEPPQKTSDFTDDTEKTVWAVNLADEAESHIGTDPSVEDLLEEALIPSSTVDSRYPPWTYLVCLAVGLSVGEWFLYQRRRID